MKALILFILLIALCIPTFCGIYIVFSASIILGLICLFTGIGSALFPVTGIVYLCNGMNVAQKIVDKFPDFFSF